MQRKKPATGIIENFRVINVKWKTDNVPAEKYIPFPYLGYYLQDTIMLIFNGHKFDET